MNTKFSLLYKTQAADSAPPLSNVIYNLSVDKIIRSIYGDTMRSEYFLSVISAPLQDVNDIVYRQEILRDFLTAEKLFDDLKMIFSRYDKIKNDWRELRSGVYPSGSTVNQRALLEYTFASLKVTSLFPKTIISLFSSISDTLDKHHIASEGLMNFKNYCDEMINNNSLIEISRIAALFQYHSPENYDFFVKTVFDETCRLKSCDLCGISEHKPDDKHLGGALAKFFGKKKNGSDNEPFFADIENFDTNASTASDATDDILYVLTEALRRIDSALADITYGVYDIFYGISAELKFYEAALYITRFIRGSGAQFNFPAVLPREEDKFTAVGIYDALLISEHMDARSIVLNDAEFGGDSAGVIIRGLNGTGKTSYLRAIGTSQIFAQAGLPVCAERAEISVRSAVFTHFSSAEEEFAPASNDTDTTVNTTVNTAGRFEGEVKLVADIMNNIRPYSLVLFNETFQTTSYAEGTEGIFNILCVMPHLKSKYVFVTRLNGLFDLITDNNIDVKLIETGYDENSYRVFDLQPHTI
jgi:hypothetical protein